MSLIKTTSQNILGAFTTLRLKWHRVEHGDIEDKLSPELSDSLEETDKKPSTEEGEDITRFYPLSGDSSENLYFQLYPYGLLY